MAAPGGAARGRLLGVLLKGRRRLRQVLAKHQRKQRRLCASNVSHACVESTADFSVKCTLKEGYKTACFPEISALLTWLAVELQSPVKVPDW